MRQLPALLCLGLAGCATATVTDPFVPQLVPAADVIRQVKYEIGKFTAETRTPITTPGSCLANFALTVDRAEIALTTTTTTSSGASAGAQVPINLVKLGGGVSTASSLSETQSLTLVIRPIADAAGEGTAPPPRPVWRGEPFYRAMMDVRAAIVAASDQRPCVAFQDEDDNNVAFGFAAERKVSGNVGIDLVLFSLGADRSTSGGAAHSVTLHFKTPSRARAFTR